MKNDDARLAPANLTPNTGIFIEVEDFADILKKLEGYPIAMPERQTFYGTREIGVRAPSGHVVIFAAKL